MAASLVSLGEPPPPLNQSSPNLMTQTRFLNTTLCSQSYNNVLFILKNNYLEYLKNSWDLRCVFHINTLYISRSQLGKALKKNSTSYFSQQIQIYKHRQQKILLVNFKECFIQCFLLFQFREFMDVRWSIESRKFYLIYLFILLLMNVSKSLFSFRILNKKGLLV